MGMTDNQKRLVRAVAENKFEDARKCAIACCEEDQTQKNANFAQHYKQMLETAPTLIELPANLNGIVQMEDISKSFLEGRYYIKEEEKQLFDQIMRMRKVSKKMQEMKIPYANTTLLYGESGTGKTMFGRYVAYKTGLPFCYLKFSYLIDSYMGNTSKNIARVFEYAKTAPCVLMLDELDCISLVRSKGGADNASSEMARITIGIMQELDQITNNMIVIAATNRYDRIDDAIKRRFSVHHEMKRFDHDDLDHMLRQYLDDVGITMPREVIESIANQKKGQAESINCLIREIAERLEKCQDTRKEN